MAQTVDPKVVAFMVDGAIKANSNGASETEITKFRTSKTAEATQAWRDGKEFNNTSYEMAKSLYEAAQQKSEHKTCQPTKWPNIERVNVGSKSHERY